MADPILAGAILAGAISGNPKNSDAGALVLGGRMLLDRVIDGIGPQVDRLAICADEATDWLDEFALPVLECGQTLPSMPCRGGEGMVGVLAALDWCAELGADQVVTVAVETPFFTSDLVARLMRTKLEQKTPIALAAAHEKRRMVRHSCFGLWDVALRSDLRVALEHGAADVTRWSDQQGVATAVLDEDSFFTIRTPEDLTRAAEMLKTFRP